MFVVNDEISKYLSFLGFTGALNDKMFDHLTSLGYLQGSLPDKLARVGGYHSYVFDMLVPESQVASLFYTNEQGTWYDPSNMTTLFQDAAGTIPVTASGQPVGRILDLSGNGNHATQSTAGSRPTFRDVGGLRYLEFDGTNDAMVTSSVNLSTTDAVTVFAGLRKLNDATVGIFLEFTGNSSTTNGSFAILAPHAAANATIGFRSRGTVLSQATPAGISAPTTRVITMLSDISADSIVARVDGAVAATSVTDQGTGNYANSQINIGRRADTSSPFIGHLYGLVIRGAPTSTTSITTTEHYLASKTGTTLP